MTNREVFLLVAITLAATTIGCSKTDYALTSPAASRPDDELAQYLAMSTPKESPAPPTGLVTVAFGAESIEFWPWTGTNFSGNPQDPINLMFLGHADPREIREALLSLDGDRSAFGLPDQPPFNGTWSDAIGDVQTGYGADHGWTGGAIQLACGDYAPLRFHIRLLRLGGWTVANAHLDLAIPGTADHQVISWEVAEQFVTADLMRCGLLDAAIPMMPTQEINQPNFRTIPAILYNGIPVELRALIGGPLGDVAEDVPIGSDGHAMVFQLGGRIAPNPGVFTQTLPIEYGQTVPKPFCSSGPYDYVYVSGTVNLSQTSQITDDGRYLMEFHAEGKLQVQPVNPMTGEAVGDPFHAVVTEHHASSLSDRECDVSSWLFQKLLPTSADGAGGLFRHLRVNDSGRSWFVERLNCTDEKFLGVMD
jgi:hypothetical protein